MSQSARAGDSAAFLVCLVVSTLIFLDNSKLNVAFPAISQSIGATEIHLQLVLGGFGLSFGLALVPAGRLGDARSRRGAFLLGIMLFTFGSLVGALAATPEVLIVARVVQGVAAGIVLPQVYGVLQMLYVGPSRTRALGAVGVSMATGAALGPALGGLLIAIGGMPDGWRLLFWVNVPIGLAVLAAAALVIPRKMNTTVPERGFDWTGLFLLFGAIATVMVPFILSTHPATMNPWTWGLLAVAVVLAAGFVGWELHMRRRARFQLVDISLFRVPAFRRSMIGNFAFSGAVGGLYLVFNLYVQTGLDLDALAAGLVTLPFALTTMASSWLAGRVHTARHTLLSMIGFAIAGIGALAVALAILWAPLAWHYLILAVGGGVVGLGAGLAITMAQTMMLADLPRHVGGQAGSLGQLAQRIGNVIGVAALFAVFAVASSFHEGSTQGLLNATLIAGGGLLATAACLFPGIVDVADAAAL